MNERIQELMRQSMVEHQFELRFSPEKFAELILQDIDRIVDELYRATPLEQAAVLLTLDETIKEHFYGVEL